jgi:hypothetical protein
MRINGDGLAVNRFTAVADLLGFEYNSSAWTDSSIAATFVMKKSMPVGSDFLVI